MYSLGPGLSDQVETSLESQITGMQDMTKNQVNQAIYIGTQSQIAKTDGALQNIRIAQEFLSTTLAALETVNNELINASKAILTLLNGVVSSSDKEAAADSILNTMGMIQGPTSRDAQEGSVIKTLRQAGTGQSPFYVLTTTEAAPPTPLAAPPEAPVSGDQDTSVPLYLNGTGAIPPTTFADRTNISFHGFEASDAIGEIDGATANATVGGTDGDTVDLSFSIEIGGTTYSSEGANVVANQAINMYSADNPEKYITFKTDAADITVLSTLADADAAFKALFTGSIDTTQAEPPVTGTFTSNQTSTDWETLGSYEKTFVNPTTNPPVFTGVEEGAIQIRTATLATNTFVVQVGEHVYASNNSGDVTVADSAITLYLNGDSANSGQTIVLTTAADVSGFSDEAATIAAFEAVLDGTYSATSSASSGPAPVFTPDNAAPTTPMSAVDFSLAQSTGAVASGTNTFTAGASGPIAATAEIEITV
ncbi:MAG: hypothetical protein ACPG7U_02705, partial [Holosporaceae bacterium]